MLYIGLALIAALQLWTLWLLGAYPEKGRGGRRKRPKAARHSPARERERTPVPAGEAVAEQKAGQEPDPYEKAFRDGVSSILNYDMAAARKAVQRDE